MLQFLESIFRYGFWVLILGGFLAIASYVWEYTDFFYVNKTIGAYMAKQNYIFVRIFPPAANKTSIQEMETFLVALNATYAPKDPIDLYVTGAWHDTFTFELHARDGKIGIYCRLNADKLSLFRSALESRFNGLRIVESADPMEDFPENWNLKDGYGEYKTVMGAEMVTAGGEKLLGAAGFEGNDVYPLRSWREFQKDDMTIIADPIVQLYTTLHNSSKEHYIILQFVTTPFSQDDAGEKVKDRWRKEFTLLKEKFAADSKSIGVEVKDGVMGQTTAPLLSEQERKVLDAIGRKISEQIFKLKVRITIFSKNGGSGGVFQEVMSFFEQYGTEVIKFVPRKFCRTWDKDKGGDFGVIGPWVAQVTNQLYWKVQSEFQTKYYYQAFRGRSASSVTQGKYFTVEELAGLFHFPVTSGEDAAKDQLAEILSLGYGDSEDISVGGAAPMNLPV
jgi:hypothetical protein